MLHSKFDVTKRKYKNLKFEGYLDKALMVWFGRHTRSTVLQQYGSQIDVRLW
jgi:hypothetical protein